MKDALALLGRLTEEFCPAQGLKHCITLEYNILTIWVAGAEPGDRWFSYRMDDMDFDRPIEDVAEDIIRLHKNRWEHD